MYITYKYPILIHRMNGGGAARIREYIAAAAAAGNFQILDAEGLAQEELEAQEQERQRYYDQLTPDQWRAQLQQNGAVLQYAPEDIRADEEIVLQAIRQNPMALQYASEFIRSNSRHVLAAIRQDGMALRYVLDNNRAIRTGRPNLTNDEYIISVAVRQNGMALMFAHRELQANRYILLEAVRQNGMALEYAPREGNLPRLLPGLLPPAILERRQREAIREAIARGEGGGQDDREIVLAAVQQNGMALQFASPELQNDREIALTAVRQNPMASDFTLLDDLYEF